MRKQYLTLWLVSLALLAGFSFTAAAQTGRYKPGDRVECKFAGGSYWKKGTVLPFRNPDVYNGLPPSSGKWYRVVLDDQAKLYPEGQIWEVDDLRPLGSDDSSENGGGDGGENAGPGLKPGDRVEAKFSGGAYWKKGTVLPFLKTDLAYNGMPPSSGKWYRVVTDDQVKLYPEGMIWEVQDLRPLKTGTAADRDPRGGAGGRDTTRTNKGGTTKIIKPDGTENGNGRNGAGGAPRSLPGTAWLIDWGTGSTGLQTFLFCRSGRWEIVSSRITRDGTISPVGTYTAAGSTLTTINADDRMVQKYKMSWKGDVLDLDDGKIVMHLHYNGETQCK